MDSRNYVRVDDHLPENPKIVQVSDSAAWLYVSGLCYCGRFQTDGLIPKAVVPRLVHKGGKQHAKALVQAGLWDERGEFFEVHDYLEHQRSRSEIEAIREAKRVAGAKGGAVTAAQRKAKQNENGRSSEINPDTDNREQRQISERDKPLAPRTAREPDHLFDAVTQACGIVPAELTESSRGSLNKALKALRDVGADPAEVHLRARHWESVFPQATLTPTALAKHWPQLANQRVNSRPDRFAEMGRSLQDRVTRMGGGDEQASAVGDQARRGLPAG